MAPEDAARAAIDDALAAAGWAVQDLAALDIHAAPGVAVREFPLGKGFGEADYLLYADGEAVGVVEAKPEGETLTGVEVKAEKYSEGVPSSVPAPVRPLPFLYQSTGVETRFTNRLDPDPRSREVFSFHRPETLAAWVAPDPTGERRTLRGRLRAMPSIVATGLWPAQLEAVRNIERSLAADRPRSLVQMATGSGKTVTAISSIYRLIKHGGARRVLFLVDRLNLGRQAKREFEQYTTPDDGRKFTELYNVQLLESNRLDDVAKVCITTIQRLYSMLRGEAELDPALEEGSQFDGAGLVSVPVEVAYNPDVPIETFDVIVADECHRSIYSLWGQVLDYFDAYLIGLTATPSKQTFGYFNQNLVMEYGHEQAVADGVNVTYDVYQIRTQITEAGSVVEAGTVLPRRNRLTRKTRMELLDEDLAYPAASLDRDVVARDQIRTVIRTFKERLFTEIFPGRTEVPKTLIFAKDDGHADEIVQIVREEFGRGNAFAEKITYRTGVARIPTTKVAEGGAEYEVVTYKSTGVKAEDLLASFRVSYNPRIVVTVDMIATGTDIKPLEIVMFMRAVKSRTFFEQMKGRGVRTVDTDTFQSVTPDARHKTRFVLVDCVGVTEQAMVDAPPLERQPSVAFEALLRRIAFGSTDPDDVSTLAGRLARLDRQLTPAQREAIAETAGGATLRDIVAGLVTALDPDRHAAAAREAEGLLHDAEPTPAQVAKAAKAMLRAATAPLASNPALRAQLLDVKQQSEQVIDTVSKDTVLFAGHDAAARERAEALTSSFEQFLAEHRDEIAALQVLYGQPYARRLRYRDVKELAETISAPPRNWTTERLWQAYEALDKARVRGSATTVLTNVVSLVRYALHQDDELVPFPDRVRERFAAWVAQQEATGRRFDDDQRRWLEDIRDHIAGNAEIQLDDLELTPFTQRGGPGKAFQLFGRELPQLLEELNGVLAA